MNVEPTVRFIPLGGLGEIGMNCFALEQGGKILIVDCGVAFPDDELGVDVLHPDFSWLLSREQDLLGLFITHGHEDHIGAVPYLLSRLAKNLPVFAPAHAHSLLVSRLEERGIDASCLRRIAVGEETQVGPFRVEAIAVAHSIIDATALCIHSAAGVILHTGDFDLDEGSSAGHLTDKARFVALGQQGVRLLLSDSTNVDKECRPRSEADVADTLMELVLSAKKRVVVGIFASNIHRLVALARAAEASGRKLCFLGRSLQRHQRLARELGHLEIASDLVVSPDALRELPREQVLAVAGGSQGEGPSALRRLAARKLPSLAVEAEDLLVLSSRVIPGNEKRVFAMVNAFARLGLRVESTNNRPGVHVSGHASRAELAQMIEWLKPQSLIPVHGTLHHLRRHEELARALGVVDTKVVENGSSVEILKGSALQLGEKVTHGLVRVSLGGSEVSPALRRERGELARSGVVFVSLVLSEKDDELLSCQLSSLGVAGIDGLESARLRLRKRATVATLEHAGRRMLSFEEVLKRAIREELNQICGEKPRVEVQVSRLAQPSPALR